MAHKYHRGTYRIENPQKYRGNPSNVEYRSSWEFFFMRKCDLDPSILFWSSEEVVIPYISPADSRGHRYFVDFLIEVRRVDGTKRTLLIEIKPYSQTLPPKIKKKPSKGYINEVFTYGVNQAKWAAAREYCKKKGWEFVIITENELGIK